MIDTLKVRLDRPILKANHKLTIQAKPELEGRPIGEGVLLQVENGQPLTAGKVYYNGLVNIDTRWGEMFLNMSLPKIKAEGKANVWPVNRAEAGACLKKVNEILADEIGVITDLDKASVSRIDIFSNADSVYSFNDYRSLFETLNFKRQMSKDYGTTFLFHNGQRETCIYDKRAEQGDKGNETASLPKNLIRWEYRLKRSQVCKPSLSCPKAETLTTTRLLTEWPRLVSLYDEQLKNALRQEGSEGQRAEVLNLKSELLMSIGRAKNEKRSKTQGGDLWLDLNGAKGIFARAGSYGTIKRILKECDFTQKQVYTFMKNFYELIGLQTSMDFYGIDDLKKELYNKLTMSYRQVA